MAYDKNTDYMAIIQNANSTAAQKAAAEQARNAKIADMNKTNTNPNGYTQSNNYGAPAGFTGSTAATGGVSNAVQSIMDEMNKNSQLWYSDPANRAQYEQANQGLGSQLSGMQEQGQNSVTSYAPTYDPITGTWKINSNTQSTQMPANQSNTSTKPNLMGTPLGDLYGLTYDMDQIKSILDKATEGIYDTKKQEYDTTANQFYNNASVMQSSALDTLRKSQAMSVATGASRGMSAANELSMMLGTQQEIAPLATDLANQRNLLAAEEAAAYSKNASTALSDSNALKQAIAQLDLTKYGYDTQGYIGELDYLAALEEILASKYSSDKTLEGVKYNADSNLAASKATASKYGSTSNSYTGGNAVGTATKEQIKSEVDEGISKDGAYTLEGTDLKITQGANGKYLVESEQYETVEVTEDELQRIINNKGDMNVLNADNAVVTVNKSSTTTNTKNMAEREVLNYYRQFGKAPLGWEVYNNGATAVYTGDVAAPVDQNVSATGKNGQQIAVGYNGFVTKWTYDKSAGLWKSDKGNTSTESEFKKYLKQPNNTYVKSLN